VFRRAGHPPLTDSAFAGFCEKLSRDCSDTLITVRHPGALLAKVDIGAFGQPAVVDDEDATTMVAGEPLVEPNQSKRVGRYTDVVVLHEALKARRYDALRASRGTFSLAHYERANHQLTLVTDRLGIRPVYFWSDAATVVFSSTLRLLESLACLVKDVDLRGLSELIAFGYPLGSRTAYANVRLLQPAEMAQFNSASTELTEYWRWQDVERSAAGLTALSKQAFDAFIDGVRLRQRADTNTTAFLSGGLDSRCVVAALRSEDVGVHSFNFARIGSEDRVYGAQVARAAETIHEEYPLNDDFDVHWSALIASARRRSNRGIKRHVERPHLIWSGDGGSVALGHVYMGPPVVQRCLADDLDGAAAAYVGAEQANVPLRLLEPSFARAAAAAPLNGAREELLRLRTAELLQSFYLMLLHNDQHHHLHRHFEDIDLHRVELQLPFFDAEFVAVIASIPIQERLYHRFYNAWLANFPPYVANTYWQAYPGHEGCPVPKSDSLAYQWDPSIAAVQSAKMRWRTVEIGIRVLMSPNFARTLMRRRMLAAATLIHASGLRNFEYVILAARTIQHHWSVSQRRCD
jgi:asparagine synthase (glutamine-hydrolysing)